MNELVRTLLVNSAVFSILFGAMLLVRKLFAGRMSAALRYALWAAVAVKLLLPFGFESSLCCAWRCGGATAARRAYGFSARPPRPGGLGRARVGAGRRRDGRLAARLHRVCP